MMTLKKIMDESRWVVKMQGWRKVGTYAELEKLAKSEECRDFDLCAEQPEHLKPFYERYFKWCKEHGWTTIPEYYKDVYLVDENEKVAKPKREWTEDEIRELIQTNDKVLYGALRRLYDEQTADEQETGDTKHRNGAGFNGADAKIMSSFAEFLKKTGFLTEKQKMVARRKLAKYTRQLTRLANV